MDTVAVPFIHPRTMVQRGIIIDGYRGLKMVIEGYNGIIIGGYRGF